MKKSKFQSSIKTISLVLTTVFISLNIYAQNNSIKFGLATEGRFNIEYENRLSSKTALSIGVQIYNYDSKGWLLDFSKDIYYNEGLRLIADYKLFLLSTNLDGFYFAPSASIGNHNIKFEDWQKGEAYDDGSGDWFSSTSYHPSTTVVTKSKIVSGSLGLKIGYQINRDWFIMDFGFMTSRSIVFSAKDIEGGGVAESRYGNEINGNQPAAYIGLGFKF